MINTNYEKNIRPVILAGGLGTRLRPRTNHLPKPMLPIEGRPILWYVLNNLRFSNLKTPIVSLDYKGEIIMSYFALDNIDFRMLPEMTMIESMLKIADTDDSEAFLGFSADVLMPPSAIKEVLTYYSKTLLDCVLFVKLSHPGHKKWDFDVNEDHLRNIFVKDTLTDFERVILLMKKESLIKVRTYLGENINEKTIPDFFAPFNTGWILLLKVMIELGISIYSQIVDIPVWNINTPSDFDCAGQFVRDHMKILG